MLRHLPYALIFAAVSCLHAFGLLWPIDRLFVDAGYALSKREASGHLVLIQMDPRSLREIGVWPWPRTIHARLIDRLTRDGVTEIGYDVDFSSRSTPAGDEALAEALDRAAGKVILPAFRQRSKTDGGGEITHETQPLGKFVDTVQLGNVIFSPAPDGLIRGMKTAAPWQGGDVPAMSALLAGPAALNVGAFQLDFGIDVNSVPRHSLVDVLEGRVPAASLKGKKVLVGAAATELGDQHAVPVYGRLHGIEVQALAFESLVQGRALHTARPAAIIVGLLMITLLISSRLEVLRWQGSAAIGVGLGAGFVCLATAAQIYLPVIIPSTAAVLLVLSIVVYSAYRDLWANAIVIFRQRMNLMHQRAFIHEVLDNSFDGLVVTDPDGVIVAHNPAAEKLLRVRDGVLDNRSLNELLPASTEMLLPGPDTGASKSGEAAREPAVVRFNTDHGESYYLEFLAGRFVRRVSRRGETAERRTGDRMFHTYTFRDVTQRVNREIAERQEKERAVEESRAKSEVLASMSHELRTPLNAILGFSEIMKNEVLGPLTDSYRSYADGVHESGRHLLNLIDEMLDVARVDGGQFTMEDVLFDVGQAVEGAMRIVEGWRETRHRFITLELADDLPQMLGGARLVKQSVINLISNAIKYSDRDDAISVKVWVEDEGDGDLVIEVKDTGIGIEPDQLPFVTKPFYRGSGVATRSSADSVGLGLALVDAYIRAHNGRVEIFSKPGLGTSIRLIFPAARLFTSKDPETSPEAANKDNVVDLRKPH